MPKTVTPFLPAAGLAARVASIAAILYASAAPSLAAPPATPEPSPSADAASSASREARFLGNIRQLTFEGKRAGEGYFSADGKKLVFQSEREPGNPFYQIYELDLETGDTRRISPGLGNTTCSFINPVNGDILFASTHGNAEKARKYAADELAMRASGKERRYSWAYEPEMDIWVERHGTHELTRLTDALGYDAEGSYSPDGKSIVFCSLRAAYQGQLSAEDKKMLEVNASYFGDIYVMDADGKNVRRLTDAPGYDGGPFFSRDGKKIIWRHFDKHGVIADVWTMNADGTGKKQITDFGAMSWAPYFDATDQWIVFASNKLGFANFEVYAVDAEGTREPVRVTYSPGFDGLPVPSPDGKRMAWTSNRSGSTGSQIFMADLNDAALRKALADAPPRIENSKLKKPAGDAETTSTK